QVKTAPIVCYESIYGAFVTQYVRKGAQFMSIITNDAWWGNTEGHRQLLSYARLRAIENRRAIARSANTGISAFINSHGQIIKRLGYEKKGALKGRLQLHDQLTFYTIYGDYLARWAIFLFVLLLCIALSGRLKEKSAF
ncbi:MAG: apolipoprotein N-acyltransferase, partial [Flavobacteriaceae bacterium]